MELQCELTGGVDVNSKVGTFLSEGGEGPAYGENR